jgi:HEAT repeat protein
MMRHIRHLWTIGAAAALVCFVSVAQSDTTGSAAVDELREVLRQSIRDTQNKDLRQFRIESLKKAIKKLGIGDYRRALLLTDWRDSETDEAIAAIDRPIREELINLFVARLRETLKNGTLPAKLAAITEIGECGFAVRGSGSSAMASELAPDLVAHMKSDVAILRIAAARALGKINPEPKLATKALGELMTNGTAPERVAAADGLGSLLRSLVRQTKTGYASAGKKEARVEVTKEELAVMCAAVVPQAGRGLSDPDVPVRRLCLETLRLASYVLGSELVPNPPPNLPFAPPGLKLSADDLKEIDAYRKTVEEERTLALPVARALDQEAGRLGRTLSDPVAEIRYLAAKALEDMGYARQQLERKLNSVPVVPGSAGDKESRSRHRAGMVILASATELVAQKDAEKKEPEKKEPQKKEPEKKEPEKVADPAFLEDPLKPGLVSVMREIAARFTDPNVRVRLSAADALEPLGPLAAPVVPLIVRGLNDPDLFVRWATARVLMRIGPVDTNLTVPLLAPLLCDPDLDVRLMAAQTLGSYGEAALPAVSALAEAAVTGDAEQRIRSIEAITGVGPKATAAIPALVRELSAQDGRVRLAAARALGSFGAAARKDAIKALERALFDNDPVQGPAIRQAAADSLLAITSGSK